MNEQQPPHPGDRPVSARTEAAYLAQQASDASAAIGAAIEALKLDLAKGIAPQTWAKQYPWVAVGAAAVAGFAAASAMVPSKEEQALKKLERIERALYPQPEPERGEGAKGERPHKSLGGKVLSELFSTLKPALTSLVAAYAGHATAVHSNGDGHHEGNGHSAKESDPNQF